MYIQAVNMPTNPQDGIDVIIRWFSKLFAQLGHFIAENLNKVADWLVSVAFPQLGHFIAENSAKVADWLISVAHAANEPCELVILVPGDPGLGSAKLIRRLPPVKQHPYTALSISFFIFLGPWILLLPLFLMQAFFFVVLSVLGFGLSGIVGGSPAALYQSLCYGGHTPSSSIFAMLQSSGTHYNVGTVSSPVLLGIRVVAGVVGLYVLIAIIMT
ncbi:hypothetical protein FPV67DRAFT_1650734 [Lyophyllum atratum]|nr:hypothetical protein FPV67DRAFT_1650734 [Lyophyllum atratum]